MTTTPKHDERIAKMTFASVFPHYMEKVERKGRTRQELLDVIHWLTGFSEAELELLIEEKASFATFFGKATLNPKAHNISGSICGYKIQDIQTPLTKQVRYLDKLVDDLAKGKKMEKLLFKDKG